MSTSISKSLEIELLAWRICRLKIWKDTASLPSKIPHQPALPLTVKLLLDCYHALGFTLEVDSRYLGYRQNKKITKRDKSKSSSLRLPHSIRDRDLYLLEKLWISALPGTAKDSMSCSRSEGRIEYWIPAIIAWFFCYFCYLFFSF